ncbi:MAG: hypothetical protein JNM84_01440, partial [Planctomycetes bacterium]|nr:hypothetical protein [Planctomycetota bacterium]
MRRDPRPQDSHSIFQLTTGQAPWGDYGSILVHGMASHLGRDTQGRVQLERTGPWMPALSNPYGALIATDSFREELKGSGMRGLRFRLVTKARIVKLAWERWDGAAAEPKFFPRGGEPESYILGRKHDPALADQLGDLWELHFATGAHESRFLRKGQRIGGRIVLHPSTWNGADLFGGTETRRIYVSARM